MKMHLRFFLLVAAFFASSSLAFAAKATRPTYTYTLVSSAIDCPTTYAPDFDGLYLNSPNDGSLLANGNLDRSMLPEIYVQVGNLQYIAIISNTSRIAWINYYKGLSSIVIDNDGARLYTMECDQTLLLPIPNLLNALSARAHSSSFSTDDRDSTATSVGPSRGSVTVTFVDQCSDPINHQNASLSCAFFFNSGKLANPNAPDMFMKFIGNGSYTATCQSPNFPVILRTCEETLGSSLDWIADNTTFPNRIAAVPLTLHRLHSAILNGVTTEISSSTLSAFDIPTLARGYQLLSYFLGQIEGFAGGECAFAQAWCSGYQPATLTADVQLQVGPSPTVRFRAPISRFTSLTATQTVSLSTITYSPSPPTR